ncbi:MAG: restriction endonuclease subunit S [Roseovarius sp.]|nr:restriction endonuclease subunit S [Roseovarius sp.]
MAAPLLCVRPDTKKILPEFLVWWINQPTSQSYLAPQSMGTMIKMVGKWSLEDLEISVPSLQRQRKIADFFNLSVKERQLLEEIKNYKASHAHGILIRMALETREEASTKKSGLDAATFTPDQARSKAGKQCHDTRKNQHAAKHPNGWVVKGADNIKKTKVTITRKNKGLKHG